MNRFPYLPHTERDIAAMLEATGHSSLDELFAPIPDPLRLKEPLDLPAPATEWALNDTMEALAAANPGADARYFFGAGSYDHYIPATLRSLASRSEFVTAYTPYQPEVSQGTLQAIYEFQTMITALTGMEVATASHYDGGTALAEALLIGLAKKKSSPGTVALSALIHPAQLEIVRTYLKPSGHEIILLPADASGRTDFTRAAKLLAGKKIAALAVQSPNFFGVIEDLAAARTLCDSTGSLMIASFTEALSLGLLKSPGEAGADLVAGEGQSLGITPSFGGPGLGLLASTAKLTRSLPGRLVGKTVDRDGERGFVLTLATREQHIRREKASSNICSNNGLNALSAAIYLASVGKMGIRTIARQNHNNAVYLKERLGEAGFSFPFTAPFFNEFVAKAPEGFASIRDRLIIEKNIHAGLPLQKFFPELADHYLFCATETARKEEIDLLLERVRR